MTFPTWKLSRCERGNPPLLGLASSGLGCHVLEHHAWKERRRSAGEQRRSSLSAVTRPLAARPRCPSRAEHQHQRHPHSHPLLEACPDSQWLGGGFPVGFLPVAGPNQNRRRPLGLSLQHGRQSCRKRAFHLVQTVQSLFKMTLLPLDGGEQPDVLDKDIRFLPRTLSTGGRHLPSTNRLGLLKPLSSNSTPTDHSVTTATSLAGWLHIQWPTTTLVVTLQCLTGAWDRCSSSNLGTSGPSGGREREATCVPGVLC